jgi:AbrB family looped-hinge helix DNA binding protein
MCDVIKVIPGLTPVRFSRTAEALVGFSAMTGSSMEAGKKTYFIQERGQVTLPKEFREKYGLEKGDEVVVRETEDSLLNYRAGLSIATLACARNALRGRWLNEPDGQQEPMAYLEMQSESIEEEDVDRGPEPIGPDSDWSGTDPEVVPLNESQPSTSALPDPFLDERVFKPRGKERSEMETQAHATL